MAHSVTPVRAVFGLFFLFALVCAANPVSAEGDSTKDKSTSSTCCENCCCELSDATNSFTKPARGKACPAGVDSDDPDSDEIDPDDDPNLPLGRFGSEPFVPADDGGQCEILPSVENACHVKSESREVCETPDPETNYVGCVFVQGFATVESGKKPKDVCQPKDEVYAECKFFSEHRNRDGCVKQGSKCHWAAPGKCVNAKPIASDFCMKFNKPNNYDGRACTSTEGAKECRWQPPHYNNPGGMMPGWCFARTDGGYCHKTYKKQELGFDGVTDTRLPVSTYLTDKCNEDSYCKWQAISPSVHYSMGCYMAAGWVIIDVVCAVLGMAPVVTLVKKSAGEAVGKAAERSIAKIFTLMDGLGRDASFADKCKFVTDVILSLYSGGDLGAVKTAIFSSLTLKDSLLYGATALATLAVLIATDGALLAAELALEATNVAWLVNDTFEMRKECKLPEGKDAAANLLLFKKNVGNTIDAPQSPAGYLTHSSNSEERTAMLKMRTTVPEVIQNIDATEEEKQKAFEHFHSTVVNDFVLGTSTDYPFKLKDADEVKKFQDALDEVNSGWTRSLDLGGSEKLTNIVAWRATKKDNSAMIPATIREIVKMQLHSGDATAELHLDYTKFDYDTVITLGTATGEGYMSRPMREVV